MLKEHVPGFPLWEDHPEGNPIPMKGHSYYLSSLT